MENYPPYPPQGQPLPQTRNWWQRNWLWFVPTGCATLLVVLVLFVGAILLLVMSTIKSTDAYKTAVYRAESSEQVAEALGKPIDTGTFVSGNVNVSGSSGQADLQIPVKGPKGKGTLYVVGTKEEGTWTYSKMKVRVDGTEQVIDLL